MTLIGHIALSPKTEGRSFEAAAFFSADTNTIFAISDNGFSKFNLAVSLEKTYVTRPQFALYT